MRKAASIGSIVFGILLMIGGVATWVLVATTLGNQNITTSEDACLAGQSVNNPWTAYCEAKVIEEHALDATGGLYYAEMDREDPLRATAATASFLQASLFTSILAFGVAAMSFGMGVLFIFIGLGIKEVEERTTSTASTA